MGKTEQLSLIFVNKIGSDVYGKSLYEFVFSTTTKDISGENWESSPAMSNPQPPHKKFIELVGRIKTDEISLDVVQESGSFCMDDAIDRVIALAWEKIDGDNDDIDENEKRLVFNFGEQEQSVIDKLYSRDIHLQFDLNGNL